MMDSYKSGCNQTATLSDSREKLHYSKEIQVNNVEL